MSNYHIGLSLHPLTRTLKLELSQPFRPSSFWVARFAWMRTMPQTVSFDCHRKQTQGPPDLRTILPEWTLVTFSYVALLDGLGLGKWRGRTGADKKVCRHLHLFRGAFNRMWSNICKIRSSLIDNEEVLLLALFWLLLGVLKVVFRISHLKNSSWSDDLARCRQTALKHLPLSFDLNWRSRLNQRDELVYQLFHIGLDGPMPNDWSNKLFVMFTVSIYEMLDDSWTWLIAFL